MVTLIFIIELVDLIDKDLIIVNSTRVLRHAEQGGKRDSHASSLLQEIHLMEQNS